MRARMALHISGIGVDVIEVALSNKPEALRRVSPKATVPVLVLGDGTVLDESLDIMRWSLAAADPEQWLAAVDAGLIAQCDGAFKRDLDTWKYCRDAGAREAGLAFLAGMDARLAVSPGLCRNARGFTDIAVMPFVRQFAAVDRGWFAAQPLALVRHWLDALETSALFAAVMIKPNRAAHSPAP